MIARLAACVGLVGLLVAAGCRSVPETQPDYGPDSRAPAAEKGSEGVSHTLRAGETLYGLAKRYGVSADAIARSNRIADPRRLQIGQQLWIPGVAAGRGSDSQPRPPASRESKELGLVWPVRGKLSSGFGWRAGDRHDGIDIPAERGTPVHAAQAGRVIHSGGGLGDYGKVVIVKHSGRYSTVYAHNRRVIVKKGQFIEQGDVVAEVGSSGNASGPHVHFELRRDRKPLDPLMYLP